MKNNNSILITGASGMIGRALFNQLRQLGFTDLLHPNHTELDLNNQKAVMHYFSTHKPEFIFHLAAMVGGIHANHTLSGDFIYRNTQMHLNVIHAAHQQRVKKLLFPGSACTYPKFAPQPIPESAFLDGMIERTNIAYAAAKINGIAMCQAYRRQYGLNAIIPMPTNAYGPGDNFNPTYSHVIPALMQRFHDAAQHNLSEITLWGSGQPLREFIFADDLANGLIFLMQHYNDESIINIGTQQEISILSLAQLMADITEFKGKIVQDTSKPDGAPRKCLDSSRLYALGWKPSTTLREGLQKMYQHHFKKAKTPTAYA